MRLRPYIDAIDYAAIGNWIADPRTHALWCAGRFPYPLSHEGFRAGLESAALRDCDAPFVATADDGTPVGFFCCSVSPESNAARLKFVMIDPARRGQGLGREMLRLACRYAFAIGGASEVTLGVFSANAAAQRCYAAAGFREESFLSDAFRFGGEVWGRRGMAIRAEAFGRLRGENLPRHTECEEV